jgi:hypothetical protein
MSSAHGRYTLGENVDATGAQTAVRWPGGKGVFMAEAGTWAGTATLQMQSPQGTWINVPSVTLTADGMVEFDLPHGQIRLNHITSNPTDLYAWAASVAT